MRYVTFCIIALVLSASAQASEITLRVVVFGDSLTSGYQLQPTEAYPAKLGAKLREVGYRNVETLNMSREGETTTDALERMETLIAARPDIVVLELGAGDVLRGISPNLIQRNLSQMISQLVDKRVYVILMGVRAPRHTGAAYMQQIDAIYYSLAERHGVPFYPNVLEGVSDKPQHTLADGLHPNTKGVDVMVENTYRLVDSGLRWKWEVLQYQEQQRQSQRQLEVPKF